MDTVRELAATGIGSIDAIGCLAVRWMFAGDAYALCSLLGYLADAPE